MFANKLKMDSVAEAVKNIMSEEESGLRMAAHAAHRQGKKMFSFQGKTYPVKVQGEEVTYGEAFSEEADCVTEPKAKEIAKKEVHGHEKKMHKEEADNPSEKMVAAYGKSDQEETPARKTIKAHGGPVAQPKISVEKPKFVNKALNKEEVELEEREMTAGEKSERERLVKSMKKGFKGFRERYGKKAKNVMYATATKRAMGEEIEEEVEQIDELKKSTLGSYVKSAARDASVSRKIGADFQNKAEKSRNPSSKAASSRLADKFNAMAQKRHAGIGKAVERLTKEDSVEEESIVKKNRTMDTLSGRVKVPADTHNQHMSTKVELKSEGWEDMMKSVKDRAKPQPSGGSGVKQGSRYGGSKQKDKPEHDEKVKEEGHVEPKGNMLLEPEKNTSMKKKNVPANKPPYKVKAFESKRPDQDNVPFVTSESKPLTIAKDLAHKAMKRMKSEMLGKTGTSE